MQVANDVASAKELPSCEARPGRRVNNSAAGKLQGGELREGALSVVSLAESAAFVAYEASSDVSALPPLERRDAGVPASKLRCDEDLGGETQQGVSYLGVYLQWSVQSVHRGEQGGQRAGVRLAKEGRVQGCRGDGVQESGRDLRAHRRKVSTADCRAYAVRALASALEACSPEMEASLLASLEASAAAVTAPRRALATLVSTSMFTYVFADAVVQLASAKELSACWCVKRTNPSSAQVSASTCHSPWVTLKAQATLVGFGARSAPRLLEPAPGPHQARARPAPGPHQARTRPQITRPCHRTTGNLFLEFFFPTVVPPRDNWIFFLDLGRRRLGRLEASTPGRWRGREASMPGRWRGRNVAR